MTVQIATVTLNPAIDQTASIPNFTAGEVNRVVWEQTDPGGKGVNVASFLAAAGYSVSATGLLGRDNPELFQALFAQKAIADRFIRIPGKTRVNVKIVDDIQQQVTDINFPGQAATYADLNALKDAIATLATDHDWFVLSGSLPTGAPPTIYAELVQLLNTMGKTVVLDASGESFRNALAARPTIIKPNRAELEEALGQVFDSLQAIAQAARRLIEQGIGTVAVSMGADGAIFVDQTSIIHAQAPSIAIKSTVGAGDAMVAGIVTGMLRGLSLAGCARLATAFSMGALSQVGPRLPPLDVLEAGGDRVAIHSLQL
jgi:1-phosphofructokinase